MTKCQPKAFVIYKGYPTRWNDVDWLSIIFSSETGVDFTNFSAQFKIGGYTFTNNNLFEDWIINLNNEQTETLPLGINTASLIVYDTLGEGKPFTTNIPILVKDWVDGEVDIDTYKATIFATIDNKNEFIVNVETAKVNLDWVEGKIAEHNNSTDAHPYIRGLISSETEARENADSSLSQRITENTNRFSNYRTRVQQDVIDNNLQGQISSVSGDLRNYRTASAQDLIDNAQNSVIEGKQNKLTTSQMESVNSGITSISVNQITLNKNAIANETVNRQNADNNLQSQIDAISASSDVTDIVGTYAELQQYDTSKLKDNDIVKVLNDESQNGETTYYRWNIHTETFSLIGEEGPYYTKSEADIRFATAAQGAKADTALQPSALNGYATETWVGQQGFLTSTALSGYATELWVAQQGYLTGITSAMVTTALGYTPYNASNPEGYTSNIGTVTSVNNISPDENGNVDLPIATDANVQYIPGEFGNYGSLIDTDTQEEIPLSETNDMPQVLQDIRDSIPDTSDFVTMNTTQKIQAAKAIFGTDVAFGSDTTQKNLLAVISNSNSLPGNWIGRLAVGAKNKTFIMGTYGGICVLGAHSWTNAQQGTGAAWEPVYINPDGDKAVYIGGSPINGKQALMVLQNVNANTTGTVKINRSTNLSNNFKDVACWSDDVKKFDFKQIIGYSASSNQMLTHDTSGNLKWVNI